MHRPGWLGLALLAAVAAGTIGCSSVHRSETTLRPDGSVERAIYQPWNATPESIRKSAAWKETIHAPDPNELERQDWSGKIPDLPRRDPSKSEAYFAAWGNFASVKDIPDHVEMKAPEGSGLPSGKLVRRYSRNDLVFVVEHHWRERLTDIVRLEDMRKARDELADLMIRVGEEIFNELLGKEYDATDLVKWARTEGKTWLAELTEYLYLYSVSRRGAPEEEVLVNGLAEVFARHGLKLKVDGKFLEKPSLDRTLQDYVIGLLTRHVRRKKDGQPVSKEVAAAWLKDLFREDKGPQGKSSLFELAAKQVIDQKYGGEAAFKKQVDALAARIVGLYYMDFLASRRFDYTMTLPGEVIETNGQILGSDKVRWQFDAREAYPHGHEMRARSLDPQRKVQQALLEGQPLTGREAMLRYLALVEGQQRLLDVLRQCQRDQAMTPLYDYRRKMAGTGKDQTEVRRVDRLLKLLKLPPG